MFLKGANVYAGKNEALRVRKSGAVYDVRKYATLWLLVEGKSDFIAGELRCIAVFTSQIEHNTTADNGLRQYFWELLTAPYALTVYKIADALIIESLADLVGYSRILT